MSRTAVRKAHEAGSTTTKVTCGTCGHKTEIMTPEDPEVEVVWECNHMDADGVKDCLARNVIEGHAGEPGEGALNPAASSVSDAELLEAGVRRGLIDGDSLSDEQKAAVEEVRNTPRPTGVTHRLSVGGSMTGQGASSSSASGSSSEED